VAVQQAQLAADDLFRDYDTSSFFDEMFAAFRRSPEGTQAHL
jgi:hypothetical protein